MSWDIPVGSSVRDSSHTGTESTNRGLCAFRFHLQAFGFYGRLRGRTQSTLSETHVNCRNAGRARECDCHRQTSHMMFPPSTIFPVARRPKLPLRLAFEQCCFSCALAH